jgi:hypothetical protein
MESNHLFNLTKIVLFHLTTRAGMFPRCRLPATARSSLTLEAAGYTYCDDRNSLAGDDGLEPPNVGIKIRCLTNLANPQQKKICKQCRHVISTIHPIALVRTGVGTLLGLLVQCPLFFARDSRPPLLYCRFGWPATFYSDFHLLTLAKLGGNGKSRTFTAHRMKVLHYHYATLPYRTTLLRLQ